MLDLKQELNSLSENINKLDDNYSQLITLNEKELELRHKLFNKLQTAPLRKYWCNYNCNTFGKNTYDCVARALAIAYDTTYINILELVHKMQLNYGYMVVDEELYEYFLRGWMGLEFNFSKRGSKAILVRDFVKAMRVNKDYDNTYFVVTPDHATVIKYGYVIDAWDSTNEVVQAIFIKDLLNFKMKNISKDFLATLEADTLKERNNDLSVLDYFKG